MEKELPIRQLIRLVRLEEGRTKRHARRIRISQSVAFELGKMDANDWYEASNGWTELLICKEIARRFAQQGPFAANGISLSFTGPVIEVSTELDAPNFEIIEGIPYDTSPTLR